jgi:NhaP-type Na+/H+ or K+/H+ antiporter
MPGFHWPGPCPGRGVAIPLATADGAPFPGRHDILVISFAVILVTLVVQGATPAR